MSNESRHNPMAQMKEATGGRQLGVQLQAMFVVKDNTLVLPSDRIRAKEDGTLEVFAIPPRRNEDGTWGPGPGDAEMVWQPVLPGFEVVPEGTRMGLDRMDVVVALVGTMVGGMLTADGRVMGKARHLRELFREDAQSFMRTFGAGPQVS